MVKVIPLRFGTIFKKAFGDHEVFSAFVSDVLGVPIKVDVVHQEFRYPETVGRVNVTYDLFAEDVAHRTIVEIQHIREPDFFERFLHYHAVSIVEQITEHRDYRTARTVYTVVVLTTPPRDERLSFSVAVTDMDPVNEQGNKLGVLCHRLVFLNPKNINDQTPPAARRWMELIADSLDGVIDEGQYRDDLLKRVIGAIGSRSVSPDELARIKDEAAWESVLADGRAEGRAEGIAEGVAKGRAEGAREMLFKLARALGIVFGPQDLARIEACDDLVVLSRWMERVPTAKSAADVFE
ncbi:MAG: PD-(D/E)XK nuclease family transposase [Polyangiaceae bacterium]